MLGHRRVHRVVSAVRSPVTASMHRQPRERIGAVGRAQRRRGEDVGRQLRRRRRDRRYHRGDGRRPRRRRSPRAVPLAPRAGAHRHPRRDRLARGPRAGRQGDLGRLARLALRRGDGPRDGPADRLRRAAPHLLRRVAAAPARRPAEPTTLAGGPRRVHAPDRAPHAEQLPPAGPVATSRRRRWSPRSSARSSPSGRTRASTSGTPARSPRSSRRRSSAGCATSSGTARAASACCTSGGVMANFIAMALVRDVHLRRLTGAARPRAAPRSRASASTPATRRTSRSPARSTSSASRPRPCVVDRRRRPVPPPRRARRRGDRRATGPPACGPSPSPPSPARRTRARSTSCPELADARRSARACGSTSTPRTAAPPGSRRATRDRVPGLDLADSVTIDPHKWFFQAYDIGALVVRDGRHLRETFDRSPEYYRGGEAAVAADAGDERTPTTRTPASSTSTSSASRAPAGSARSSCGRRGSTSGTSGLGRLIEVNDDVAAYLARRCAEADDLEALPADPELSVVCFRHLPGGGGGRGDAMPDARPRRPPGPPRARRSRHRATAGSRRPRFAAAPSSAPAS